MTKQQFSFFSLLAALLVLALAPAASAAAEGGSFELYGGVFDPDSDELTTYGLRGAYQVSDPWAVELTVGEVDAFADFQLADLSLKRYFGGVTSSARFFVFGGAGWAWIDLGPADLDTATAHAGLGVDLYLGSSVYLRPDVRWRWFDDLDVTEAEVTLALGFSF